MLNNEKFIKVGFCVFTMLISIFCISTNAQTTRRTNSTKPVATPTPLREVPEIISRADDLINSNPIIVQPIETEQNPPEQTEDNMESRIKLLNKRVNSLESTKENQYDQKQKRLLLNLDILSRAEQRADALRKQLFDLIERENEIQTKLDQLNNNLRPESIDRSVSFAGSLRPEELREQRKKSLEIEKTNLSNLLTEITNNKTNLQENVQKADTLVDKLRLKLEKDIDDALAEDEDN
jgi:TolA-binding protein